MKEGRCGGGDDCQLVLRKSKLGGENVEQCEKGVLRGFGVVGDRCADEEKEAGW